MTRNDFPVMIETIEKYIKKDSVIFEGGCGLGRWLFFLKEKGFYNIFGLDHIYDPLAKCKEYDKDINVIVGSVDNLPIKDKSIDFYLSGGVIEHFEEGTTNVLKEASRVIKNKGVILVSVPYQNFYRSTVRKVLVMPILKSLKPSYRSKNRVFYQYYYSKRDLKRMLLAADFEILEWFYKDTFHLSNKRGGIYLEFPFLRRKHSEFGELNYLGEIIARLSEYISQGIFSSMIVIVGTKKIRH